MAEGVPALETLMVSQRTFLGNGPKGQDKLLVAVSLHLQEGSLVCANALIDTGAEINLLRRGLVVSYWFFSSDKPKRFITANQAYMEGGGVDLQCMVEMEGTDVDTSIKKCVICPTRFYDADIGVDAILSYECCVEKHIDVR